MAENTYSQHGDKILDKPDSEFANKFANSGKIHSHSKAFEEHVMHRANGEMRNDSHFLNGTEHANKGGLPSRSGYQHTEEGAGVNFTKPGGAGHTTP